MIKVLFLYLSIDKFYVKYVFCYEFYCDLAINLEHKNKSEILQTIKPAKSITKVSQLLDSKLDT